MKAEDIRAGMVFDIDGCLLLVVGVKYGPHHGGAFTRTLDLETGVVGNNYFPIGWEVGEAGWAPQS